MQLGCGLEESCVCGCVLQQYLECVTCSLYMYSVVWYSIGTVYVYTIHGPLVMLMMGYDGMG